MFGGFGARDRRGLGDEGELVVELERVVEAALEADRGGGLRAHRLAAERAGDVTGEDLDAVRQLQQAAERVEEVLRALSRADGEIRPSRVADEERVARQDEPGLVGARAVDHGQAGVLGTMARRVDRPQDDLAELELERRRSARRGRTRPLRPGGSRSGCRARARAGRARRGGRRACGSRRCGRSRRPASPPPRAPARPRTEDRRSRRRRLPRHRPGMTRTRDRRPETAGRARDMTLSGVPARARRREHTDGHTERERHAHNDAEPRKRARLRRLLGRGHDGDGAVDLDRLAVGEEPRAGPAAALPAAPSGRRGRERSSASRPRRPPAGCW